MKLDWKETSYGPEAILGNFDGGDGVRFSVLDQPTCYRRGRFRLLVEIEDSLRVWGCFDDQDQPMRYYHDLDRAKAEAQAIADVLVSDWAHKMARRDR